MLPTWRCPTPSGLKFVCLKLLPKNCWHQQLVTLSSSTKLWESYWRQQENTCCTVYLHISKPIVATILSPYYNNVLSSATKHICGPSSQLLLCMCACIKVLYIQNYTHISKYYFSIPFFRGVCKCNRRLVKMLWWYGN